MNPEVEVVLMREQAIAKIHIVSLGTATTGLSHYIAICLDTAKQAQDISYQLTAIGTRLRQY